MLLALYFFSNCQSHTNPPPTMKTPDALQNRQPAEAGIFYPSDPTEILQMIETYFAKVPVNASDTEVLAIISPHAGYVFSGEVADVAFNQLVLKRIIKPFSSWEVAIAIHFPVLTFIVSETLLHQLGLLLLIW